LNYPARIFAGTLLVLGVTVLLLVIGVERSLRTDLESEIRVTLEREASLVREAWPADSLTWQDAATRFAASGRVRITVIDQTGRVRADSDVPAEEIPQIENHAARPEVKEALAGRVGWDKRASATVGKPLMYLAVPGGPGVVRTAMPLDQVDAIVRRSERPVWAAALLALAMGSLLALIAGRKTSEPLKEIRAAARAMTQGETPSFPHSGIPDIDALVADLREMHHQLATRIEGLRKSQAETAAIVDSMVEGVLSSDAKGRVITANPAARRLLGYGEGEELPVLPLLFRSREAREAVTEALGGAPVSDREIEIGAKICLLNARPTTLGGAVIVLHDLTRVKRLETVRRDFVANISHELKTPLTNISGYAETLLDHEPEPPMRRKFLETILANARRMQLLVDEQLDLSRIESGGWTPAPELIDLRTAFDEAWGSVAPRSGAPRFELDLDPTASRVVIDPEALRQILRNLLGNASRHTTETGRITGRAVPDGSGLRVSVIDTGSGMAAEHLPRIFERFYRVDPSRSREHGGTGLGLSIVKHLVEAHGGRVWAESELGRGTAMHLWLPKPPEPAAPGTNSSLLDRDMDFTSR
jgi:signal transduction histidine kinase